MKKADFMTSLAEYLSLETSELRDDTRLDSGTWDSLAVLSIIGLASEEFNLVVNPDDVSAAVTVADLLVLFQGRLEN